MQTLRDIPVIWSLYLIIILISAGALLYASVGYCMYYNRELQKTAVAELESVAEIIGLSSAGARCWLMTWRRGKKPLCPASRQRYRRGRIYYKKGGLFARSAKTRAEETL